MSKEVKQWDTFMEYLLKLNAVEFIGVAKMLGVEVVELDNFEDPGKDFSVVLLEMVNKFNALDRRKRRNLLKIIKKAGRK